jgi:hypothetical protein
MKKYETKKITVFLDEEKESSVTFKYLGYLGRAELQGMKDLQDIKRFFAEQVLSVDNVFIDGKLATVENLGDWPDEMATDILTALTKGYNEVADSSKLGQDEKN